MGSIGMFFPESNALLLNFENGRYVHLEITELGNGSKVTVAILVGPNCDVICSKEFTDSDELVSYLGRIAGTDPIDSL